VKPSKVRDALAELDLVRRRRELFFWTIAMALAVIVLCAIAAAFLVSLVTGNSFDVGNLGLGVGITSISAGVGKIVWLLRRVRGPGPRL
jgi:hypothetical protein